MNRQQWNDRAVIFGEFDIRQGRAVRAAFAEDAEGGSYACLAASLRYADTKELVFASPDEIWMQPFRLQQRIVWLAGQAARVNGIMREADEDDDGAGVQGNGHDEAPGPSH